MSVAIGLTLFLVGAAVFIHYEVLRGVFDYMERLTIPPRSRLLAVIGAALVGHFLEILLFAAGYYFMHRQAGLGQMLGQHTDSFIDFIYFSAVTYTTLGIGDVFPSGHMRMLVGAEALTGLILIGWTTSFTYLAMRDFWGLHPPRRRQRRKKG